MKRLAVLLTVLLTACVPAALPGEASVESSAAPREGGAVFAELDRRAGREANVFFSPVSVEQAFGLLHAGTAGETRTQLESFFAWPAGDAADRELERRREALLAHGTEADIRLANALWLSDTFRFRQSYLAATRERYDATAETLDFNGNPAGAARRVNGWAADKTNGLIDEVVSARQLADNTAALLTNALYFEAEWQHMFDGFEMRPVLFGDGHEEPFRLMTQTASFAMAEERDWRAIRLPYRGGRFVMDVVMPERRRVMDAAPSAAVFAALDEKLAAAERRSVELKMPRFEIDYDTDLVEPLQALGLTLPFDRNRADLSAMAEPGQQPLFVKDATHITKLQVYEDGTKAAAVTVLRIVPVSGRRIEPPPVPFVVDRPFVAIIRDLTTGTILFIGRIAAPQPFTPAKAEE